MIKVVSLFLTLALVALPTLAQAADPEEISWEMLAPPVAKIENPFENLTEEQMDTLRQILRFETQAERSDDAEARVKAEALRTTLAEEGIDVDGLFAARISIMEKRKAAASGVNKDILDKSVRMPGYVLPLEFIDRKAVEFLLVPTVGACIHTPPPPPNQIVHVSYPEGIEVNGLFTPVWITGTMMAQNSIQKVGLSDGQTDVSVSYTMRPNRVEKYGK